MKILGLDPGSDLRLDRYLIVPVPAPRQNRRSRWNAAKAPSIARYHAFCDQVRSMKVQVPPSCYLRFEIPVPKSGRDRIGSPHTQRPDLDNLVKALLDAVFGDDSHVYRVLAEKFWAGEGAILVGEA